MNELHIHLDGAVRPETAWNLYTRQHLTIPAEDLKALRALMVCTGKEEDLNAALAKLDIPLEVMQCCDAIERIAYETVVDLAEQGTTYAELRFAPILSTKHGLCQRDVVDTVISGVNRARREHPEITVGLILCMMRGVDKKFNEETVELAAQFRGTIVCGLDIAGSEDYPLFYYADLFRKAAYYKIPFAIHCGETTHDPLELELAIDLGARRISHGIVAAEYPELITKLIQNNITLEICPTANYITNAVGRLSDHPVKKLFEAGVKVCVNSDDPTLFNTNVTNELKVCRDFLNMTYDQCMTMQRYAYEARFLKK